MSSIKYFYFNTLQETMEDIDKNGDGVIDLDEYIGESTYNSLIPIRSLKILASSASEIS